MNISGTKKDTAKRKTPLYSTLKSILSACEVKINNSLFERPFKVRKNGVLLFGIFFLRFRDIYVFVLCK